MTRTRKDGENGHDADEPISHGTRLPILIALGVIVVIGIPMLWDMSGHSVPVALLRVTEAAAYVGWFVGVMLGSFFMIIVSFVNGRPVRGFLWIVAFLAEFPITALGIHVLDIVFHR
jgi:hypothetical protein